MRLVDDNMNLIEGIVANFESFLRGDPFIHNQYSLINH